MIEGLKPFYNRLLRPIARGCASVGIHPNAITTIGVIFFAVSAALTINGKLILAVLAALAGSCFDGLDGVVAREFGKKSRFGAILDSTADRITEILWIISIAGYYQRFPLIHYPNILTMYFCFAAITGSMMVSYVKACAEANGVKCSRGILQRPERLILLALFQLCGRDILFWGVGIIGVLAYVTTFERLYFIWKACKNKN